MRLKCTQPQPPFQRNRPLYALAAALVIGTGLLWRSGLLPFPDFLIKYGGDSLWALVVILGFGIVFPRTSTIRIALAAVVFAWSIEFLQLYQADLDGWTSFDSFGRLVLGATFNGPDLCAYVIGITFGALADRAYLNKKRSANQET